MLIGTVGQNRVWSAFLIRLSALAVLAQLTHCDAALLVDAGFENKPDGTAWGSTLTFSTNGIWTLDAGSYRSARNGITPYEGTQMLSFDATAQASTDIYQLVDVSAYSSLIATGGVTFTLSAYFNAPAAHSNALEILAYFETSTPLNSSAYDGVAASAWTVIDPNPSTWQQLSLSYKPPAGTHFLAFGLNSMIDGHVSYADAVDVTIQGVPEPGVAPLLVIGAVILCRTRLRRQTS